MIYGKKDELVPIEQINELNKRLSAQKGIKVEFEAITDANHFFSKSEDFSSLIPTSRIIHPKFIDFCSSLDFPSPLPIELAKLVDESSKQRPDEFGNLRKKR